MGNRLKWKGTTIKSKIKLPQNQNIRAIEKSLPKSSNFTSDKNYGGKIYVRRLYGLESLLNYKPGCGPRERKCL
jgi:hypothetical protein